LGFFNQQGIIVALAPEVIVVDDNRDTADSLRDVIQALGHTASSYYCGETVLQAARAASPLCVFLDVNMIGMNGLELAQSLRREFGDDIVLVAISGGPEDDATVAKAFETVDHYFLKPVQLEQIKTILGHD